mgnify:CR=1 FL=1
MQEEVNQKVISLSIQGVKITASVLKAALRKFLEMDNRRKQKATQVKMAEKTGRAQEKGREKARKKIEKKNQAELDEIAVIGYFRRNKKNEF